MDLQRYKECLQAFIDGSTLSFTNVAYGDVVNINEDNFDEKEHGFLFGLDTDFFKVSIIQEQPLSIPWEFIKDYWQYAAMDKDGKVFLFDVKPNHILEDGAWKQNSLDCQYIGYILNTPTNAPWDKSLTKRPT